MIQLWAPIYPALLSGAQNEVQLESMCGILDSYADCIRALPFQISEAEMVTVCECLQKLLTECKDRVDERDTRCNSEDYDEQEAAEIEGETAAEDEFLGTVYDILDALVDNGNVVFLPYFHKYLFPVLESMIKASPQSTGFDMLSTSAICIISQAILQLAILQQNLPIMQEYAKFLFDYALRYLQPGEFSRNLRHTSAFAIGACAIVMGPLFGTASLVSVKTLVSILNHINPENEDDAPLRTNAISALDKILMTNGSSLEANGEWSSAELWNRWLRYLPCSGDEEEAQNVHSILLDRIEQNDLAIIGIQGVHIPHIIKILSTIVNTENTKEQDNIRIQRLLPQLKAAIG
jgi:hypothetical protein